MGSDWPFSGLTMVGLKRLDDLQACVESVVADGVEGDVIEAGDVARRRVDPRPRDPRLARRRRPHRLGRRLLPGPAGARPEAFPEDGDLDLSQVDFWSAPAEEVRGYFARFGLDRGSSSWRASSARPCPQLRGHPLVGHPPRRRHLRGDLGRPRIALPRPVGGRLPDRRRLRADPGVPGGGRGVPRASMGSRRRSRESTGTGVRWRREERARSAACTDEATRPPERQSSSRRARGPRARYIPTSASSSWSASCASCAATAG